NGTRTLGKRQKSRTRGLMSSYFQIIGAVALLFLLFGLRYVVPGTVGDVTLIPGEHRTLVVFGPSLGGRVSVPDLERLVRDTYSKADFLIPNYSNYWFSNS